MSSGVQSGAAANIYQAHPLRDAAGALGGLSPDAYVNVVSVAQQTFLARMSQLASDHYDDTQAVGREQLDDMPQLAEPHERSAPSSAGVSAKGKVGSDNAGSITGAAKLTELLGQLVGLIGANSVQQLKQNADIWNQLSNAAKDQLEQLSSDCDAATQAAQAATDDAKAATDAADQADAAATEADQAAKDADAAYQKAKDQGASPDDLDKLKKDADEKHGAADAAHSDAKDKRATAKTKTDEAGAAATKATDAENKMNSAVDSTTQQYGPHSLLRAQTSGRHLQGAAELTAVLGELQSLIAKNNVEELDTKQKVFHDIQVKREEAAQKKSDEYQEQVKKAEEMQKTMGCIGKIVGWLVTAISVIAAIPTGGASLAIAAVGVALMASDEICQAATGTSFMEEAMRPLMDNILKPMMNFFATQIANALKACGVASDQAQLAGAIIGAILTAVVLVVAAVAGSSAVEKIVEKMAPAIEAQLARVMETSLGKALIEVVETITEKIGLDELAASMTKGVGRLGKAIGIETEEDEMLMVNRLERGAVALGVGNQAVQTAGSIVVGLQEQAAMKTLAAVRMAMADIKALSTMIKEALETFAEHNKVLGQLMQEMSDASQAETAAGKLVLRNVRAV